MGHQGYVNMDGPLDEKNSITTYMESRRHYQQQMAHQHQQGQAQTNHSEPMRNTRSTAALYDPYSRPSSTLSMTPSEAAESQRGRAIRTTSNTNMARYARAYREAKKQETKQFEIRCKELDGEVEEMASIIKRLEEENERIITENLMLKRVIKYDSKLAPILARVTGQSCSSSTDAPPLDVGLCLHVGGCGPTIEFCQRCNESAASSFSNLPSPTSAQSLRGRSTNDPMFPQTELFGGDFSAIEPALMKSDASRVASSPTYCCVGMKIQGSHPLSGFSHPRLLVEEAS
ncbi:unnamed protein product, partial [Mesorhabditis belari]|uniref:BZIP domain-containing protein n=1 Tax=Mesorhabditis belari TaxID=2138241 RepID=A0AAF3ETD1_9BILA